MPTRTPPLGSDLLARNMALLQLEIERLKKLDPVFAAEEFIPALLGLIHDCGVCVHDADCLLLSAWLPLEIQQRFGFDVSTMVGRNLGELLPVHVIAERKAMMQVMQTTGETRIQEFHADFPRGFFWMRSTISPLRDQHGQVRYFIASFADITARKAAEAAREESEARFRGIVENSRDAIMLTRPDAVIEYMSPSTEQVLGWPPEGLIGTRPNIVHPDDRDRTQELLRGALAGGSGEAEYRILTREGETRWVAHSWSPMMRGGKLRLVVSLIRDVTEQRRLAEQLRQAERLAAIGQTVADISHQLKTICLNIKGSASMIDKALAEDRTESLRNLWAVFCRSSERLGSLALAMLDYVGIESLRLKPFDLNELAREICQECQGRGGNDHLELKVECDPALEPVTGDAGKLSEVLMNLIANATDACEDLELARIEVKTSWDAARREVRVQVIDNGPGIPRDVQTRIFDPFFTTKGAKGTGLGLAIAMKTVQLHGGRLECESRRGRTVMTVVLPEKPAGM